MIDPMKIENTALLQNFGAVRAVRLALPTDVRLRSTSGLSRLLAHSLALRDLYKKAHWQTSGAVFYELHRMFDAHREAQSDLADTLAERVQTLGGVSLAPAHDLVTESKIAQAPRGREQSFAQLLRLIEGHEVVLTDARPLACAAAELGDDGTNDLIVGEVIRTNEPQSWFIAQHLAGANEELLA